jgi:hypothetical protein
MFDYANTKSIMCPYGYYPVYDPRTGNHIGFNPYFTQVTNSSLYTAENSNRLNVNNNYSFMPKKEIQARKGSNAVSLSSVNCANSSISINSDDSVQTAETNTILNNKDIILPTLTDNKPKSINEEDRHNTKDKEEQLKLKVVIKINTQKEEFIIVNKNEDHFVLAKEFCEKNKINSELAVPISKKIQVALTSIEDFYAGKYANVESSPELNYNNSSFNRSCITDLGDYENDTFYLSEDELENFKALNYSSETKKHSIF